jgi:predicted short-subunit dehydrogenase-like oxidoreductase (DUF2520 family)
MNISIIGAGNVAWHLSKAFEQGGVAVHEIYARDIREAEALADGLYAAKAVNHLDFKRSPSTFFFLCVSDDAIASVAAQVQLPEGAVLLHTSGARPLSALHAAVSPYHGGQVDCGVFYPLQTFTAGIPLDFSKIPILVEAESEKVAQQLKALAKKLSSKILQVSSHDRLVYHVAAVFSCNFTNHLWALSQEIVASENLNFEFLKPLIQETVKKMLASAHPADMQTGPAVRRDRKTMAAHEEFLQDDEDLLKVYSTLSESISDWHRSD